MIEIDDAVNEGGEELFPMPARCVLWRCNFADNGMPPMLVNRGGLMVCPNCGGSYGDAPDEPAYYVDCCNRDCGRRWLSSETVHPPHSPEAQLCPQCHEVTEPADIG